MKNILVTGATGGIGQEICKLFSTLGYKVIGFYNKNQQVANFLNENYFVETIQVDITNEQGVILALCDIKKRFGSLNAVINCAGITIRGMLQDNTQEDFDKIFGINVKGVFNVCKNVIWDLIETKGDIINLSSIWARVPASCEVLYSATKGAIESFTMSLAKELSFSGVKVNAISPGFVDTPINKGVSKEEIREFLQDNNLKRVVLASEIASLCQDIISGKESGKIFEIFG